MDGLSALRAIRATMPAVRVVMISSIAGSGSRAEEAFRLGAQGRQTEMSVKFFGQFLIERGEIERLGALLDLFKADQAPYEVGRGEEVRERNRLERQILTEE